MNAFKIAATIPTPKMNAETRQQPIADKCADKAYQQISDQSETLRLP